jgi:restriction system protein
VKPASRAAASHGGQRIILIDGIELTRLMVEREVGIRVSEVYKIKKIDENYFTEE